MQGKEAPAQGPQAVPDGDEGIYPPDREVVELMLFLTSGQAAALERAARQRSLTVAQALRQLVRDFLKPPAALGVPLPSRDFRRTTTEEVSMAREPETPRPEEEQARQGAQQRQVPTERVSEEGQDVQNDPNPTREKRGGTPLGSDPRE